MSDYTDICELISGYAHAYDANDIETVEHCFTDDAIMRSELPDGTLIYEKVGRNAVLNMIQAVWAESIGQRRHVMTNILITESAGNTATVLSYFVLIRQDQGRPVLGATGVYHDTVVKDRGWRFRRRDVHMDSDFRQSTSTTC